MNISNQNTYKKRDKYGNNISSGEAMVHTTFAFVSKLQNFLFMNMQKLCNVIKTGR